MPPTRPGRGQGPSCCVEEQRRAEPRRQAGGLVNGLPWQGAVSWVPALLEPSCASPGAAGGEQPWWLSQWGVSEIC